MYDIRDGEGWILVRDSGEYNKVWIREPEQTRLLLLVYT